MEVVTSSERDLTPISLEVISNQATINIGTIGHVAHGKSTLVKALTGVNTVKFKEEKVRSITIHLGYANAKIYQCDTCPRPKCYRSFGSNQKANSFKCKNQNCQGTMTLKRHVSFVDCFAPETMVMMSDGSSRQIKDIQVGDQVMGDDGTPRNVLQTQSGQKELYRINYCSGSFVCTNRHILILKLNKIIYEITVEDFLKLPKNSQESSHLFRSIINKDLSTEESFTISKLEKGPYIGIETDGNNRFLLEDFLVVHNCPGHDCLMATMINGTSVMDTALLIIGGNQPCPQPQTQEHLAAAEIMQLQNIGIIQNKVDLLPDRETAQENYRQIKEFVKGTVAEQSPIIPTSSVHQQNIDVVCDYICTQIPLPKHDFSAPARMTVVRSFDINKPGTEINELKGGVPGGTLTQGILRVGQDIEIRPGVVKRLSNGEISCQPLRTKVMSLYAEKNSLQFAVPGGLIGVGTNLDPSLTMKDLMKGQVIGDPGTLPDILSRLEISYFLMKRLIGSDDQDKKSKPIKVDKMSKNEILMINVGSISSKVQVTAVKSDLAKLRLQDPICSPIGERIAISRRIEDKWRLIGWGKIMAGTPVPV